MTVVVDASFGVDWLTTLTGERADRVLPDLVERGLVVPVIFWLEVASGLRRLVRHEKITPEFRAAGLRRLRALQPIMDASPPPVEAVIAASDRFQLTIYDAAYLELALRTGSALATHDGGLVTACDRAGLELIQLA